MTLDRLAVGTTAVIRAVRCGEALRRHLLEMGFTPGTEVTFAGSAPTGDPVRVCVRGYVLALRKADAARIETEDIRTAPGEKKSAPRIPDASGGWRQERNTGNAGNTGNTGKTRKADQKMPLRLALAGNQNCGKTTLYNRLTGSDQHVGNFPGVTVERKDAVMKGYPDTVLTDLPGIYSLSPCSGEETVTRNFLLEEKPDGIINILDANSIERGLYLTLQLAELGIPTVLALNMMDEVRANGGNIDCAELERALGMPVFPVSAAKNEGAEELADCAVRIAREGRIPGTIDLCAAGGGTLRAVKRALHAVYPLIGEAAEHAGIPYRFASSRLLEGDAAPEERLALPEETRKTLGSIVSALERESGTDPAAAIAEARYAYIGALCGRAVTTPRKRRERVRSERIDRILTGKYTAFPAFFLIMGTVFFLTFSVIGARLSGWAEAGIGALSATADRGMTHLGVPPVVHSLVTDGIFAGVGSVLSFLPIIVTLFFFLSILEDSGYMARAAFLMDHPMRKLGLTGRSFVPLLLGFGCTVPAVMAARTLSSERDRTITVFLTPFMSCSAKLPIYTLFASVFFPSCAGLVTAGLYVFGIAAAMIAAAVLCGMRGRSAPAPFVMELPDYRFPRLSNVLRLLRAKAKDFLTRAFTVILSASVGIWLLQNFDTHLHVVSDAGDSLLASLGESLLPLFRPLGFSDWRIPTALITGLLAKESIVSTLTVLLGGTADGITALFTPSSALAFLVFCLLYTPCAAAIAAIRRETGSRAAVFVCITQCVIAWGCAFLVILLSD